MNKKRSKMWRTYHIPERLLKWYQHMDYNKKRPVLVISDCSKLINKCLVVELTTNDDKNPYRIKWYEFYSKKHNMLKTSYILPNCIHTINLYYLTNEFETHNKKHATLSDEIKKQILDFINELLK